MNPAVKISENYNAVSLISLIQKRSTDRKLWIFLDKTPH